MTGVCARKRGVQILSVSVTIAVDTGVGAGLSTGDRQRASYAGGRAPVGKPCDRAASCFFLFSHRFALEGEVVSGVNDAIENRVGEGWIAQVGVPMLDG